ncbi:MAG: GMC family oxidoreductase N-terminal domain-containing protein, partial [Rhodobacteraceae bacterium]|nr:GMC family oxidoreductase N-terminal domain-containing protein [Paracoccaceae bacterium]
INAQIYTRGHPLDFDEWAQMGCTGWDYADVLPYFRKTENNDSFGAPHHGQDGPLGVSRPAAPLPICEAFFEAAASLGIPFNPDMAGESREGVGYYQLTQRNAVRSSTAAAFLWPAAKRPNLEIRTGVHVNRLKVANGRITGVDIDGETIGAGSEVILSSGAIGSPRLLMLSGIGPVRHLEECGVTAVCDAPNVGNNLQDHLDLFTISACTGPHTYDAYASGLNSLIAGLRFALTRSGPAASSLFETGGFGFADEAARSPDIQFHLGLGSGIEAGVAHMPRGGVTLNSAYLRPRSRGTVRLHSADPKAPPLIDPNYWADPYDKAMGLRGLQMAREILSSKPLSAFIEREVLPGQGLLSQEDLIDYACSHAKTDHHPVGTCRMGIDPDAVVDPQLRANCVDGLRIADASIMPKLISSNTNATTIMIAENAADMIKTAHQL